MKRPKYGWTDQVCRVGAVVAIGASSFNLFNQPWGIAFAALALGLQACSGVERLRHDLCAALRGDTQ